MSCILKLTAGSELYLPLLPHMYEFCLSGIQLFRLPDFRLLCWGIFLSLSRRSVTAGSFGSSLESSEVANPDDGSLAGTDEV